MFRHGNLALARFDVARASDGIDLHQLAVDIGRKVRRVRIHRLSHAHGTALQQGDTRSGGGKLRDGQFERHSRLPCSLVGMPADQPRLPQIQRSFDARSAAGAIGLTMPVTTSRPESLGNRGFSGSLSRTGTENGGCVSLTVNASPLTQSSNSPDWIGGDSLGGVSSRCAQPPSFSTRPRAVRAIRPSWMR